MIIRRKHGQLPLCSLLIRLRSYKEKLKRKKKDFLDEHLLSYFLSIRFLFG